MESHLDLQTFLPIVVVVVVACSTVTCFKTSFGSVNPPPLERLARPPRFEDEDDVASQESEEAFRSSRYLQTSIVTGTVVGLSLAISMSTVPRSYVATWAMVIHQESRLKQRYLCSCFGVVSAMFLGISIMYQDVYSSSHGEKPSWPHVIITVSVLLAFASVPRRPSLFYHGHLVDQEHGVSLLDRCLFSWGPFQGPGRVRKETISLEDLPCVAHSIRLRTLLDRSEQDRTQSLRLWRRLITAVAPLLFALHRLLQCFEQRDADPISTRANNLWGWVVCLGLGLTAETFTANWLMWVTQMKLTMPLIALVNGLVLQKMTRKQLNFKTKDQPAGPAVTSMLNRDSSMVAQACDTSSHFPNTAFRMVLDLTYLSHLIEFRSVLVGVVVSLILVPLATRLSKRNRFLQSQLAKTNDQLSNLVSEALSGLHHIRFSSTEKIWEGRILHARKRELDQIWRAGVNTACLTLVTNLGPILVASVALSVHAYETGQLSPSVAFASLGLFSHLHEAFRELPLKVTDMYNSWASCERLQQFLDEPEQEANSSPSVDVVLADASLAWQKGSASLSEKDSFCLKDVNLTFPRGELSIITGRTGAGKSLVAASLLEEAALLAGHYRRPQPTASAQTHEDEKSEWIIPGSTAYVSQPPWVENCTVKENILFGCPYDGTRYAEVIEACALTQDLDIWQDGSLTVAGVNGAALSGGQKWRVALARALYSRAELLVLEDVLSAVNAHVARWLCEHALTGRLAQGRTRILVTHHLELCVRDVAYVVNVHEGTATGRKPKGNEKKTPNVQLANVEDPMAKPKREYTVTKNKTPTTGPTTEAPRAVLPSRHRSIQQVFTAYLRETGGTTACLVGLIVTAGYQLSTAGHSWWLAKWTAGVTAERTMMLNIGIYLGLSTLAGIALAVQSVVISGLGLRASSSLFQRMIRSILKARLRWIDTVPTGQILQRLELDMYHLDQRTAPEIATLLGSSVQLLLIIASSAPAYSYTLLCALPLLFSYWQVGTRHLSSSAKLKKLIGVAHAPILEQANSVAAGLMTIRAFGQTQLYLDRIYDLTNLSTRLGWHLSLGQRWLSVRLGLLGATFVTASAAALTLKGTSSATAGFTIVVALQLTNTLATILSKVSLLEMGSYALDRVLELGETPTENVYEGDDAFDSWPTHGAVQVDHLTVRYNPALPPALKNVSFSVGARQRLGIVGRTGAGKSSLASALLRFIDASEGKILIDGLDISALKLATLRKAIVIVPQDPFLFSGTLRSNLELHQSNRTDEELREVLRRVHLPSLADNLDMSLSVGGANLSHGQQQLICLARAILARCSILVLDEATNAMDAETDDAIQRVLRDEFAESTILVIAHRLASVAGFDRILVLSNGQVAQFGAPRELLAKKDGLFSDMVGQNADREKIEKALLA